ncbi:unnamed protein product, partial [Ectocarpus sp. 4 AP-2014]
PLHRQRRRLRRRRRDAVAGGAGQAHVAVRGAGGVGGVPGGLLRVGGRGRRARVVPVAGAVLVTRWRVSYHRGQDTTEVVYFPLGRTGWLVRCFEPRDAGERALCGTERYSDLPSFGSGGLS